MQVAAWNTRIQFGWWEDGCGISTTIYDCRASADEAAAKLEYIWAKFGDLLIEEPVTELFNRTANMLELGIKKDMMPAADGIYVDESEDIEGLF